MFMRNLVHASPETPESVKRKSQIASTTWCSGKMPDSKRLAPVDREGCVFLAEATELPEGFALADAPPAVFALRDRRGHAFGLDHQRGQSRAQSFGLFAHTFFALRSREPSADAR